MHLLCRSGSEAILSSQGRYQIVISSQQLDLGGLALDAVILRASSPSQLVDQLLQETLSRHVAAFADALTIMRDHE